MVQVTEAVFSKGVSKPIGQFHLRDQQRVRLVIEPIEIVRNHDRTAALNRLRAVIASMRFSSSGPLSSRGERHDRSRHGRPDLLLRSR
jgi:predicted DNA-binding antitoxin AbrB/MazE fold protein